jgi:hypothetical protein
MSKRMLPLSLLAWLLAMTALSAQVVGQGRIKPTMPRLWDQGLGSWVSLGGGYKGLMLGFSRQLEHAISTARLAFQGSEGFGGGSLSFTFGLPLSTGRVLAAAGAGAGCLVGKFDDVDPIKARLTLDADLQVIQRLTSRLAVGLYAIAATNLKKVYPCVCLCLIYGRWEN